MLVVMHDKNMIVRSVLKRRLNICDNFVFLGFEEREYYPDKNANRRVRRERVPVRNNLSTIFEKKNRLSFIFIRVMHGNQYF